MPKRQGSLAVIAHKRLATDMPANPITIEPLTPVVGAEVYGVNLSRPLDEDVYRRVREALLLHQVIFFRDQHLDLAQLEALGRRFGELHVHPTQAGITDHPELLRVHVDAQSSFYAGRKWHSDVSSEPEPPLGSILHLHEVPPTGGDTLFSSMYAAFDALSVPMKQWLCGLSALHETRQNLIGSYGASAEDLREDVYPKAVHPVVCAHPETGGKVLFVNESFTTRIVGLEPAESQTVLEFLYRHIASPRFQCRFRWRPHSVAFWDNRCVQHLALWDYYPHTRSGHRATIAGTRPCAVR